MNEYIQVWEEEEIDNQRTIWYENTSDPTITKKSTYIRNNDGPYSIYNNEYMMLNLKMGIHLSYDEKGQVMGKTYVNTIDGVTIGTSYNHKNIRLQDMIIKIVAASVIFNHYKDPIAITVYHNNEDVKEDFLVITYTYEEHNTIREDIINYYVTLEGNIHYINNILNNNLVLRVHTKTISYDLEGNVTDIHYTNPKLEGIENNKFNIPNNYEDDLIYIS